MKHVAMIAVLMTLATVPAFARQDAAQPVVLATTTAAQHAWAQVVSDRIQSALNADPFPAAACKGDHCTASAH